MKEGSNWTLVFLFNGCMFAALGLNFLMMAIGAFSSCMRQVSGFFFCLTGYAFLYSLYQAYKYHYDESHYSRLCELSLHPSYSQTGLLEKFQDIPKTFAEDYQLLFGLVIL